MMERNLEENQNLNEDSSAEIKKRLLRIIKREIKIYSQHWKIEWKKKEIHYNKVYAEINKA